MSPSNGSLDSEARVAPAKLQLMLGCLESARMSLSPHDKLKFEEIEQYNARAVPVPNYSKTRSTACFDSEYFMPAQPITIIHNNITSDPKCESSQNTTCTRMHADTSGTSIGFES